MARIPVTNATAMPIYVGAAMVPPGETRHFEEHDVPLHLRPAPAEPEEPAPAADPAAALLEGTVAHITAALPALPDNLLDRIGELEQQAKAPRKTLLAAIAEETLNRAEAKQADLEGRN